MRVTTLSMSALTLVLTTAQAPVGAPSGTKLTADQIREQLIDHTTQGLVNGLPFVQYVAPDGTQKIKMTNFSDSGTWRLLAWCRTWKIANGGKEECATVYKSGDTFYTVTATGVVRASYTAKPGNTDHL
jgi:hypothetical protein